MLLRQTSDRRYDVAEASRKRARREVDDSHESQALDRSKPSLAPRKGRSDARKARECQSELRVELYRIS